MKIEPSILDGKIEKKGLYGKYDEYERKMQKKLDMKAALDGLNILDLNELDVDSEAINRYGEINTTAIGSEEFDIDIPIFTPPEEDTYSLLHGSEEIESIFDASSIGKETVLGTQANKRAEAKKFEPELTPEEIVEIGDTAEEISRDFEEESKMMREALELFD